MKFFSALKTGAGQAKWLVLLSFFLFLVFCVWLRLPGLVFLVFVPFFLALRKISNTRRSYVWAFLFGCGFHTLALFWITNVSWILFVVAVMLQAFLTGFFGLGVHLLSRQYKGIRYCLFAAALWVNLEYIRSLGFWGMPAGLIGYELVPSLPLAQTAALAGVYGLSFMVIFANALLAESLFPGTTAGARLKLQITAGLVVFVPFLFGMIILNRTFDQDSFRVVVIQPNISNQDKSDANQWNCNVDVYETMTRTALAVGDAELVIWPETAVPFFLFHQQRADILRQVRRFVFSIETPLLLGAQDFREDAAGPHAFNIAALLTGQDAQKTSYAKMKLVPVLEYMPVRRLIPWVRRMGGVGVYEPGQEYTVFEIDDTAFSAVICFEGLFPGMIRAFVRRGADFIINLTNDAPSLGQMGFYYQRNAEMLRLRAIENRRSVVRVANNGISMVIDPWGRIIRQAPAFARATFTAGVPLAQGKTPFLLFGNWLIWFCLVALVIGFLFLRRGVDKNGH